MQAQRQRSTEVHLRGGTQGAGTEAAYKQRSTEIDLKGSPQGTGTEAPQRQKHRGGPQGVGKPKF
eukprot:1105843-Pelagomonas_calceolata.AAC.2